MTKTHALQGQAQRGPSSDRTLVISAWSPNETGAQPYERSSFPLPGVSGSAYIPQSRTECAAGSSEVPSNVGEGQGIRRPASVVHVSKKRPAHRMKPGAPLIAQKKSECAICLLATAHVVERLEIRPASKNSCPGGPCTCNRVAHGQGPAGLRQCAVQNLLQNQSNPMNSKSLSVNCLTCLDDLPLSQRLSFSSPDRARVSTFAALPKYLPLEDKHYRSTCHSPTIPRVSTFAALPKGSGLATLAPGGDTIAAFFLPSFPTREALSQRFLSGMLWKSMIAVAVVSTKHAVPARP